MSPVHCLPQKDHLLSFLSSLVFRLNSSEGREGNVTALALLVFAGEDPGQPFPGAVPGGQPAARQPRVLTPQQQRVQLPVPAGQHSRQDRSVPTASPPHLSRSGSLSRPIFVCWGTRREGLTCCEIPRKFHPSGFLIKFIPQQSPACRTPPVPVSCAQRDHPCTLPWYNQLLWRAGVGKCCSRHLHLKKSKVSFSSYVCEARHRLYDDFFVPKTSLCPHSPSSLGG